MRTTPIQTHDISPVFPILIVVSGWILFNFAFSHTGWRAFSRRYPARSRPPGRIYTSPSSCFGSNSAGYNNAVLVVFTEAGVYFYAAFLFRVFHPPFLVPWASVRRVEKKEIFFRRRYQLDIEDAAGKIRVLLPKKVEDDLFKYYKPA